MRTRIRQTSWSRRTTVWFYSTWGWSLISEPHAREAMLKLLLAITESDAEAVVDLISSLSGPLDGFDRAGFAQALSELLMRYGSATLADIQLGRTILESTRIAAAHGLQPPTELTMLGKTLLNLDDVPRTLDPDFERNRVMREHSNSLMSHHMLQNLEPVKLFASMIEVNQLIRTMPSRLNRLLEDLVQHRFEIKVNAVDEASSTGGRDANSRNFCTPSWRGVAGQISSL